MMLSVGAVVKEEPVVELAVTADAPGNWLIGVRAVMAEVAVQVAEAMAEIEERQEEKNHVMPVRRNMTKSVVANAASSMLP